MPGFAPFAASPALLRHPAGPPTALFDHLPHLIWVIDDTGRLIYANSHFTEQTGLAAGAVAPWAGFLDEDDAWAFQSLWLTALDSSGPIEFEARVRAADGRPGRWHLLRAQPADEPDGRRLWYGTATDVHDRKEIAREIEGINVRLESQLPRRAPESSQGKSRHLSTSGERFRRRSELLQEILDSLFEAVVVTDGLGHVLLFNAAARDRLGADVLARPASEWPECRAFLGPDGTTPLPAAALPPLRALKGEDTGEMELWVVGRPDTGRRLFEARGIPLRDDAGEVRGGVAVFRDVTERRRMEQQLVHLQKLEAIGHLASGIAHEINTPVQYVGDNLRFLGEAFRSLATADARTDIEFLKAEVPAAIAQSLEGVGRVAAIVRAMRDFAAPGPDEPAAVQMNRVAENVVAVTRNEWKYVAEVVVDAAADLPAIPGHARDLNQTVYHLLMNAVEAVREARPAGGGRVCVRTRLADGFVEVTVSDDGPGIPLAVRPKIFDPFFTTKTPGSHTGQGLTHVLAAVVHRHGGTVEVASDPGIGTAVTIRLPVEWGM